MLLLLIGFVLGVATAMLWRYVADCLVGWMEEPVTAGPPPAEPVPPGSGPARPGVPLDAEATAASGSSPIDPGAA